MAKKLQLYSYEINLYSSRMKLNHPCRQTLNTNCCVDTVSLSFTFHMIQSYDIQEKVNDGNNNNNWKNKMKPAVAVGSPRGEAQKTFRGS